MKVLVYAICSWVWDGCMSTNLNSQSENVVTYQCYSVILTDVDVNHNSQRLPLLKISYLLLLSANSPACCSKQWSWLHSGMPCQETSWLEHQRQIWGMRNNTPDDSLALLFWDLVTTSILAYKSHCPTYLHIPWDEIVQHSTSHSLPDPLYSMCIPQWIVVYQVVHRKLYTDDDICGL